LPNRKGGRSGGGDRRLG